MSFWNSLTRPIVGLSPMDGVTDASMRHITATVGKPDLLMTEFTSVDGLLHGVTKLLRDLHYMEEQRPIVAQFFGSDPSLFRRCAVIACALGFDGIDINMGCPAPSVAARGGGASLIKDPLRAQQIIFETKAGVDDWVNGKGYRDLELPELFISRLEKYISLHPNTSRKSIPVSVKTRIGYDRPVIDTWIPALLEASPAVITLHGRTLEQQYSGSADWEQIARAAEIVHSSDTLLLGNGDVSSRQDITERVATYGVNGVLIGRAALGNPWVFLPNANVTTKDRFDIALAHCKIFEECNATTFLDDPLPFLNMRKHLGWYIKSFPNATELRMQLYQTNSYSDVEHILSLAHPAYYPLG